MITSDIDDLNKEYKAFNGTLEQLSNDVSIQIKNNFQKLSDNDKIISEELESER